VLSMPLTPQGLGVILNHKAASVCQWYHVCIVYMCIKAFVL